MGLGKRWKQLKLQNCALIQTFFKTKTKLWIPSLVWQLAVQWKGTMMSDENLWIHPCVADSTPARLVAERCHMFIAGAAMHLEFKTLELLGKLVHLLHWCKVSQRFLCVHTRQPATTIYVFSGLSKSWQLSHSRSLQKANDGHVSEHRQCRLGKSASDFCQLHDSMHRFDSSAIESLRNYDKMHVRTGTHQGKYPYLVSLYQLPCCR